ncbi:hypothetical protein V2J09_017087 [Rumex salicifolius]
MATFTSVVSSPAFKTQMFLTCSLRPQNSTFLHNQNRLLSCQITRKLVKAQFSVPGDPKAQFNVVKEKLWKSVPNSAKSVEWKKAGDVLKQQVLSFARKTLVWLFVAWFGFSCISDAIYSVSMNKELFIPFGLFAGCLFTDFAKETSLEFFHHSEATDLDRHVVAIGCFCILLKFLSLSLPVQGQIFLLHVANGGLLQVLWLWRSSLKETLNIH